MFCCLRVVDLLVVFLYVLFLLSNKSMMLDVQDIARVFTFNTQT